MQKISIFCWVNTILTLWVTYPWIIRSTPFFVFCCCKKNLKFRKFLVAGFIWIVKIFQILDLSEWNMLQKMGSIDLLYYLLFVSVLKTILNQLFFSSFQPADKKKFPYGGMNSKKSKYFIYIFMLFFRKSKIEYFYFSFKLSLTTVCWVNFRKNCETIWP